MLEKGTRAWSARCCSRAAWCGVALFEEFRAQCPGGDERLQRLVFDRLDEGLQWLESLGAPVLERETGNPLTTGVRFDTERLTEALFRAAGEVRLEQSVTVSSGRRKAAE